MIKADLPNAYNVKTCLSNEFAMYMKEMKATISVGPAPWEHIVPLLTLPSKEPPWESLYNRNRNSTETWGAEVRCYVKTVERDVESV